MDKTGIQILPRPEFDEAIDSFARMVGGLSGGPLPADAYFQRPHDDLWQDLASGGWHQVATGESGASPLELTAFARIWGRNLVPLPFVETCLLHRWFPWLADDPDNSGIPLTFAVAPAVGGSSVIVPHLPRAGARVIGMRPARGRLAVTAPDHVRPVITAEMSPSMPVSAIEHGGSPWLSRVQMDEYAAALTAEAVGAAETAFDAAAEYVTTREQFGQPISGFQAVQHRLANMWRDLQISYTGLVSATQSEVDSLARCRVVCTLARNVCENAIQLHGGVGYTWDLGLHFYLRHVLSVEWVLGHLE